MFNNPYYLEKMMTEKSRTLDKADRQGWLWRREQSSSSSMAAPKLINYKKSRLPGGSRP